MEEHASLGRVGNYWADVDFTLTQEEMIAEEERPQSLKYLPFYERYKKLLWIGAFGGIPNAYLHKVVSSRIYKIISLYGYLNLIMTTIFYMNSVCHLLFVHDSLYGIIVDSLVISGGIYNEGHPLITFFKKKELGHLYQLWDEYYANDPEVDQMEAAIKSVYEKINSLMFFFSKVMIGSLLPWLFIQYFNEEKKMRVPSAMAEHKSPDHQFLVTFYMYSAFVQLIGIYVTNVMMILPVIWIRVQLEYLKISFKDIVAAVTSQGSFELLEPKNVTLLDQRMSLWIERHQKLCKFFSQARSVLGYSHSISMVTVFVVAWLVVFSIVVSLQGKMPAEDAVTAVILFAPYLGFFALTAAYCDQVGRESKRVFDDVYTENWMILPRKHRMSMVIIIQRTNRAFTFRGFKVISTGTETLSGILQSAYSILNFLLTMLRK